MLDPKKGDRVRVDHSKYPGVWTVVSTGPVNALLEQEGRRQRLRCARSLLIDPDATVSTFPATIYDVGELVRVVDGKFAGLYTVIKDSGTDKVNIAKLGGDGGGYLRALRRGLVRVDVSEVLK